MALPLLSPQKPGFRWPWLLLSGPAEVRAGCSLHRAGDRSALPSLHLERLFPQIALWVHAPAANRRSLPLLRHNGTESQEIVAVVRRQKGFRIWIFRKLLLEVVVNPTEPCAPPVWFGLGLVCKYSLQDLLSSVWVAESFTIPMLFFSPLNISASSGGRMFLVNKSGMFLPRKHVYYLWSKGELLDVIVWMI